MGLDIYTLQECVLQTLECRKLYTDKRKRKLKNSIVISNDGTENAIMISNTGTIYMFHHDDSTYEIIDKTLEEIVEEYINNLKTNVYIIVLEIQKDILSSKNRIPINDT